MGEREPRPEPAERAQVESPRIGALGDDRRQLGGDDRAHHRQPFASDGERGRARQTDDDQGRHAAAFVDQRARFGDAIEAHERDTDHRQERPLRLDQLGPAQQQRRDRHGGDADQRRSEADAPAGERVPAAGEQAGAQHRHDRQLVDVDADDGDEGGEDQRKAPRVERRAELRAVAGVDGELVLDQHAVGVAVEQSLRLADVERPVVPPPVPGAVGGVHDDGERSDDERQHRRRPVFAEQARRTRLLRGDLVVDVDPVGLDVSRRCRTDDHRHLRVPAR